MGNERPVVHGQIGDGTEGADVPLLPLSDVRVGGIVNQRGEVANSLDVVAGLQQAPAQLSEIQPAVRAVAQRAVIQVEAVDVNVDRCHGRPSRRPPVNPKICEAPELGASRPAGDSAGAVHRQWLTKCRVSSHRVGGWGCCSGVVRRLGRSIGDRAAQAARSLDHPATSATKADIHSLRADIQVMRSEWKTDLGEMKADLHAREARVAFRLRVAGAVTRGCRRYTRPWSGGSRLADPQGCVPLATFYLQRRR